MYSSAAAEQHAGAGHAQNHSQGPHHLAHTAGHALLGAWDCTHNKAHVRHLKDPEPQTDKAKGKGYGYVA